MGKIADGETPVSKMAVPLPKFHVARLPEEANDSFQVRVELLVANVVGRYACGEHKVCVETISNGGQVNWVFEQAGISYGPRLEPGSEACEEAAEKRKSDTGAGPSGKCAKISGWNVVPAKASVAPKGVSVASSKTVLAKATHASQAPNVGVAPRTSVPLRAMAPLVTVMSKTTVTVAATVTASMARVLKISTGAKRSAAAPSLAAKGKHAKVDVRPLLAFVASDKVLVRPQVAVRADDDRVVYCPILDSVQSAESCSSSSNDSFGLESIVA
jgi:hypothetical protein